MATSRVFADSVTHVRRTVASPRDQVVAMHLTASTARGISVRLSFRSPLRDTEVVAAWDVLVMLGHYVSFCEIHGSLTLNARSKVVSVCGNVRHICSDMY